jgi:hypothetical protein
MLLVIDFSLQFFIRLFELRTLSQYFVYAAFYLIHPLIDQAYVLFRTLSLLYSPF